jgi:Putative peptidoglycan binding domain/L,D-transpeptidase catalytic domain
MQNLKYGDSSPVVAQLQTALNFAGPTRLPRLSTDGQFGALTEARVMEFQFLNNLSVDGVVGPQTNALLPQDGPGDNQQPDPPQGRSIFADLYDGELTAYEDGNSALQVSPISGGRPGFRSTQGVFQMTSRRLRRHSSSEFPGKDNMDFALFYNEGQALHQGNPNVQSHGCIHVPAPSAEQLFDWAGTTNIRVNVVGV